MFENLRRDRARYEGNYFGFWVGAVYRFGSWANRIPNRALRWPPLFVAKLLRLPVRFFLNNEISFHARIGPGLLLYHPFNVLIGDLTQVGQDCTIFHEVTVGRGPLPGEPKIGNNVVLFAGCRLLGGLAVGDRSEIGANCVVTRNVPAYSLVVAAPSRVLPQSLMRKLPERERTP